METSAVISLIVISMATRNTVNHPARKGNVQLESSCLATWSIDVILDVKPVRVLTHIPLSPPPPGRGAPI